MGSDNRAATDCHSFECRKQLWVYLATNVEAFKILYSKFIGVEEDEEQDWCGSDGSESVPDFPFGIDAQKACENHDNCYRDAQTAGAKMSCDVTLGIDLFYACVGQGRDVVLCHSVGETYAAAVLIFPWKAWKKA